MDLVQIHNIANQARNRKEYFMESIRLIGIEIPVKQVFILKSYFLRFHKYYELYNLYESK